MPEVAPGLDGARALLGYLRDLAAARRETDRERAAADEVHWLADLPGEVYVETDAGPGDALFSVPVIPLTPPAVLEEFDGWLAMRHWYRTLRGMAGRAAAHGAEVSLVTGLLTWRPAGGRPVRDHLLSAPVRIVVDERSGRVDVVLAGPAAPRDRPLPAALPGYSADRADWVWDAVRSGQAIGLRPSVSDVLRKWCSAAFGGRGETVAFREDWAPVPPDAPAPSVPQLRLAPALVLRAPGRAAVAGHYETLLARLGDGPPPGGVAAFLEPGPRSPLLHVAESGPATIADMIGGMLARGRRVLVAVPDGAAARELHATLPEGIAGLCAAVTDAEPAGEAGDPDRVVAGLLARAADHDAYGHAQHVDDLAARESRARETAAGLADRLRDAEGAGSHDLGSGYGGGRSDLDLRLRAEAADHGWLPPRHGLPERPPISGVEAAELVRLLATATPSRRARTAQRDVDPATLPTPPYLRTLIEAEATANARAERAETTLSRRLRRCDPRLLARLDGCAGAIGAALRELGLDGHPGGWDQADHAVRAFGDALARRRPAVWERVAEMTSRAGWAERAMRSLAGHRVVLPPGEPNLRKVAGAAQQLRRFLADGGTLKRGPLRSATQRQTEPLLQGISVDGGPPVTAEQLDILFTHLMVLIACRELQYVWEAAGVSFPADVPLADRVARFARAHARLSRIRDVLPAINETAELLARAGLGIQLTHPVQWHGYVTALESALLGIGAGRATADITTLRDAIAVADHAPPELDAALAAIDARDADAYARALRGLAEARHERALQARCDQLLARLRAAHPELADLLVATAGEPAWPARLERWEEAWAWARAMAGLAELPRSATELRLRAEMENAGERLREASARLAAAQAWGECLARINRASTEPTEIVPVWIVPLWRIPDVLPPTSDAFDVVIVDGEHSAGAEALFLLWYAPRTILVGHGGPALPAPGTELFTTPPRDLAGIVTPTATLFEILLARFTNETRPRQPPPPEPEPAPEPEPEQAPSPSGSLQQGRSIVTYKREELAALVGQVAEREPDLSDDQLVEVVSRLLGCPEDEALLVSARVRYALESHRGTGIP